LFKNFIRNNLPEVLLVISALILIALTIAGLLRTDYVLSNVLGVKLLSNIDLFTV
jgi:hypothetical protein